MATERDRVRPTDDAKTPPDRFEEALRETFDPEEEASCEDADAGALLERFPAGARERRRPKDD